MPKPLTWMAMTLRLPIRLGWFRLESDAVVTSAKHTTESATGEATEGGLPEYAALLAARHTAHRVELQQTLADLWGRQRLDVVDVACGDGFYTTCFQTVLEAGSRIVAVDLSGEFLAWAAAPPSQDRPSAPDVAFLKADAQRLPLQEGQFDVAWCAQSLISLPDPVEVLKAMRRVVRPGGTVAILENDRLHELQMPWPPDLEIALRAAETQSDRLQDAAGKAHAGRFLEDLLEKAGLVPQRRVTLTIDRKSPLAPADEAFIQLYLHALLDRTRGLVAPALEEELRRLASPDSPAYLPAQKSFWMTWTDVIVLSTRE